MANITIRGEGIETKTIEVATDMRLTQAIEDAGVDILHRCGGNAKCTTCKVTFANGEPADMNAAERAKLEDNGDLGEYRLSCQMRCSAEMDVTVMMTMASSGLDDAGGALTPEIAV